MQNLKLTPIVQQHGQCCYHIYAAVETKRRIEHFLEQNQDVARLQNLRCELL